MSRLQAAPDGAPFFGAPVPTTPVQRFATHPALNELFLSLSQGFGPCRWWPAANPFEIIVGAVLVQNTTWKGVIVALDNLRTAHALDPQSLLDLAHDEADPASLESLIRPSGAFRQKAKKVRAVTTWLFEIGGIQALETNPLGPLRSRLLEVFGIGPETADSILCYAAGRRTAVVDTYARRVLGRHAIIPDAKTAKYEDIRSFLMEHLIDDQWIYEEAHALFVAAGADNCKPTPHCASCPVPTPDKLRTHV